MISKRKFKSNLIRQEMPQVEISATLIVQIPQVRRYKFKVLELLDSSPDWFVIETRTRAIVLEMIEPCVKRSI